MSERTGPPLTGSGVSRRAFLKGSGAAAAASAIPAAVAEAQDADQSTSSGVVNGKTTIQLDVNGRTHDVTVTPNTMLLDVLRYQLDLTGAKPVSMDGSSGASTVLIDGKPVTASTTLALAARGKKIETVESLGGEMPDAVCQAFIEHDAQQCGFCTPGFVVAVRAFLNQNPNATNEQIREGLSGNICRCGTYYDIIEAATALVKGGGNG